ncbi:MAG: TlpA family protein disulfide reductase [Nocardioidaceae bacterium]
MHVRRRVAALSALGVAVLVSGCSTTGTSATGAKGYAAGDGSVVLIAPADREQAPELSGPLVGGGTGDLGSERGKVVVLNVWAHWCGPCREEAPDLAAAAAMLPAATFLGINTRDSDASAMAFQRAQHVPYPSFSDQDGSLVVQMQSVIAMSALPVTVVLDKEGKVAAAVYGPTTAITIKDIVAPLERES